MQPFFDKTFFTGNRRALQKQLSGKDILVFTAHQLLQRSADTSYPFRQDGNFWYLTGVNEPGAILVMTAKAEYLLAPRFGWYRALFEGATEANELTSISGINEVLPVREGWQRLKRDVAVAKKIHALLPSQTRVYEITANPARANLVRRLRKFAPGKPIVDMRLALARARMVKQAPELAAMQAAIDITSETIKHVAKNHAQYKSERDLRLAIDSGFLQRGADGVAFESVVATGKNTQYLHHFNGTDTFAKTDVVLVDIGAEVAQYAADISRVFPYSNLTPRHKEVFEAVYDVHQFAMKGLKPGVSVRENERRVEEYMGKTLQNLGVIKTANRRNIRKYFPHATSHMMGYDVHDAADYDLPLAPNMVLTVEPGIYLPAEGIGVRIEDDVIITRAGCKTLSANLPVRLG